MASRDLLSPADVAFIDGFKDILDRDIADGRDYGGLLTLLTHRLDLVKDADTPSAILESCQMWGATTAARDSSDGLVVRITGPAPDDSAEVTALDSNKETAQVIDYIHRLSAACTKLKEILDRCSDIVQKRELLEKEEGGLRQPAETTINEHKRLLRQYNKTKDVGQQLIGLIAENRGVPIGRLYSDRDYGVGPDD